MKSDGIDGSVDDQPSLAGPVALGAVWIKPDKPKTKPNQTTSVWFRNLTLCLGWFVLTGLNRFGNGLETV